MSSNIYLIKAKSNNIKSSFNGEKIEIAKAVFASKVLWNTPIPESKTKPAKNNPATYFIELLNLKDSSEEELVFKREENQVISKEGFDTHRSPVGFLVNKEIVPFISKEVSKGSFSLNGNHVEYNRYIEWFNGATDFFMNDTFVGSRGTKPNIFRFVKNDKN